MVLRTTLAWAGVVAVGATILSAALAANPAVPGDLVWRGLVIFLGALGAAVALLWLHLTGEGGHRPSRRRTRRSASPLPPTLVQVQDAVRAGSASRPDFERVLRPILFEIAEDRLLAVGISPLREVVGARQRLGPLAADLLLSPRVTVYGTGVRGPSRATLAEVMAALEGLRR